MKFNLKLFFASQGIITINAASLRGSSNNTATTGVTEADTSTRGTAARVLNMGRHLQSTSEKVANIFTERFEFVGNGPCRDSSGSNYDEVILKIDIFDSEQDCALRCFDLQDEFLVGVFFMPDLCMCLYETNRDGAEIPTGPEVDRTNTGFSGTGRPQVIQDVEESSCYATRTQPLCQDGVFRPDPNRYYVIMTETVDNDLGVVAMNPEVNDDGFRHEIFIHDDEAHEISHWRFADQEIIGQTGKYRIRNRSTAVDWGFQERGTFIFESSGNTDISRAGAGATSSTQKLATGNVKQAHFQFTCTSAEAGREGTAVFLHSDGKHTIPQSRPKPRAPGDHVIVWDSPTIEEERMTACINSRDRCPAGTSELSFHTSGTGCFFASRNNGRKKCRKTSRLPITEQKFYIKELSNADRRVTANDIGELETFQVNDLGAVDDTATGLSQARETTAEIAGEVGVAVADELANNLVEAVVGEIPFVGGIVSVFVGYAGGELLETEDDDSLELQRQQMLTTIQDVAIRLEDRTELMIDNAIAENSVRENTNTVNANRDWFLNGYADKKSCDILDHIEDVSSLRDLERLLDTLKDKRDEVENALTRVFGTDAETYSFSLSEADKRQRVLRAKIGFDLLRIAAIDALAMREEAMLLESYIDFEKNEPATLFPDFCSKQVIDFDLNDDDIDSMPKKYETLLTDTTQMLITDATGNVRRESRPVASKMLHEFFVEDRKVFGTFNGVDEADEFERIYKEEIQLDLNTLSYNIESFKADMNSIAERALESCKLLSTERGRQAFVNTTFDISPPVDCTFRI